MIEIKSTNTKLLDKEAFEADIRQCNELCFQGQTDLQFKNRSKIGSK
jgi:hypothetical protein